MRLGSRRNLSRGRTEAWASGGSQDNRDRQGRLEASASRGRGSRDRPETWASRGRGDNRDSQGRQETSASQGKDSRARQEMNQHLKADNSAIRLVSGNSL